MIAIFVANPHASTALALFQYERADIVFTDLEILARNNFMIPNNSVMLVIPDKFIREVGGLFLKF